MEAFEGVVAGELQDLSHDINKDESTKRQRPSSPILIAVASPHLSSGAGGGCNANEEKVAAENNNKEENETTENKNINGKEENITLENNNKVDSNNDDNNNNNLSNSTNLKLTPADSSNDVNSTTAEDEDTARLLILLSQGNSRESETKNYYLGHNYCPPSTKFNSKKYIETSSNVDGKSGVFVYECKTCNRTFPSFQALGGHRASHKKPKNLAIEELKKRHFSSVFSDDYDYDFDPSPSSFSRNNNHSIMRKAATSRKTHECSYCGAEFTSGQALGGHMRRHRGSNGNYKYNYTNNNINNTQALLALSPSLMSSLSVNQDSLENKKQKTNNDNKDKDALSLSLSLSLDLNLPSPPPAENDQKNQESIDIGFIAEKVSSPSPEKRHEQQQEQTGNKESELLISTKPTLVDCQY